MTENDSLADIITTIKTRCYSAMFTICTLTNKIILILLYLGGMVEWFANAQSGAQQWSER